MALAKLHIGVDEFYGLTPIEFKYAIKFINDDVSANFKTTYEAARYVVYHIWNSAGKSLKQLYKEPKEVGLFDWETEEQVFRQQTVEEMKNTLFGIAASFNGKKNRK